MNWRKESSGTALPGAPNVEFRVPAKPLWFEQWRARSSPPTDPRPSFAKISGTNSTNSQHKEHKIYTGSGHRCGVIPYSSVVVVHCLSGGGEQLQGEEQPPEVEVFLSSMSW